ncbi:MAG: TrkA-N domain protein [Proteobacteria bacterium]|nr:TrkA-N domain protein [Pseudomonadota bacterium]MBS1229272.1 TrkA-N domain protein [Pseudomonadota bacterium]
MKTRFLRWLDDWPGRTLLATLLLLSFAHALALWGFSLGLPAAPWGDEARHWERIVSEALRLVWQPWQAPAPDAAWPAPLGRLVVPLALFWLGVEAAAVALRRHLRRLLVARRGGHAVVLGCCPVSLELVAAWRGDGRPVLVLAEDDGARGIVLHAGAAHLSGHWSDERALRQSGLAGAEIVACIAGSDNANIDAAIGLARVVGAQRDRSLPPLQLLVHVADPFLRASIDAQIDRFAAREVVELRFFSAAQIAARRLLRDFPLDFWQAPSEPRLWIFGLTPLAEELALAALRLGVYRQARPPAMALVGPDAERFRDSLLARWPGACAVGRLAFVAAPIELGDLALEQLQAQLGEPSGIYFCHHDDNANLAAALHLQHAFAAKDRVLPPLYLHSVQPGRHDLRSELGGHPWFHHFGGAAQIAAEILLGEKLDAMAVRIHEHYVSESLENGELLGARRSLQHWPLLPEDLKDDNRFVADHHFVKVRDSACALVSGSGVPGSRPWDEATIEALARVEHERWMIQRRLTGWQQAPLRDDVAKRHPDLVAWEDLGESRRELDRNVVRQVPELFAELGLSLCRQQRVLVRGSRTPWAFPEAFELAVDGLLAEVCTAPPAAVVFWIGLDSAFVWRVAERLLAAQCGRLGIVIDEPLQRVLDRLPSAEIRSRVLSLLRQAVGVIRLPPQASAADFLCPDTVIELSIDGSDLPRQGIDWMIDAAGRVLIRPQRCAGDDR